MKEQEKYIVILYPKKNAKVALDRLGTIKDWDGESPLFYNGRYCGEFSGDISKARLYAKLKDAEDRVFRICYDFKYTKNEYIPFKLVRVAKIVFTPKLVGEDIVMDFQAEVNKIRQKKYEGQLGQR